MTPDLRDVLRQTLGAEVIKTRRLGGGDINEAFAVTLADGSEAFVKTHPDPPPAMFSVEALGLRWLDEAKAIRIPGFWRSPTGSPRTLRSSC